MAHGQGNTAHAERRSVVPASNLFAFPNNTLIIDTPLPSQPLLAWPPTHRASVSETGELHITERGRPIRLFGRGEWRAFGRLFNIRVERRAVVVFEVEASWAA